MERAEALETRLKCARGNELHDVSLVLLTEAMHHVRGMTPEEEHDERYWVYRLEELVEQATYDEQIERNRDGLTPFETCMLVHDVIARWLVPIAGHRLLGCTVRILRQFRRWAADECFIMYRDDLDAHVALLLRACGADPFWTSHPYCDREPLWKSLLHRKSPCLREALDDAAMQRVRAVPQIVCEWVAGHNDAIVFPPEAVAYALETIPRGVVAMGSFAAAAELQRVLHTLRTRTLPVLDANEGRRDRALALCGRAEARLHEQLLPHVRP